MTAEKGHAANRFYVSQDGNVHLNGATVFDSTETDITATLNLSGAVTATPTELNKLAGVTAGTVTASKALVVDANSRLDAVNIGALSLGAAAGTAVTATAAELNKVAGVTGGTTTASKALVVNAQSALDVLTTTTSTTSAVAVDRLLRLSPKPTDTYSATMTIDVTYSYHVVAVANGTSATVAFTPSAAGTAGDVLVIVSEADSSGTVTATFSSTFHPSGTQVTTLSHFSSITFVSDGTRWLEVARTTNMA